MNVTDEHAFLTLISFRGRHFDNVKLVLRLTDVNLILRGNFNFWLIGFVSLTCIHWRGNELQRLRLH